MGKYQQLIKTKMEELSKIDNSIFIGYNIAYGSKCYGTTSNIPRDRLYEMPVTEDLMTGIATGMALNGMLPILIFERQDFMLIASDQIINHLDKINRLSEEQFNPKVIIRAIVGCNKPFDPGLQHMGNYTSLFKETCKFPVYNCYDYNELFFAYSKVLNLNSSTMIVEYKGLY